MHWNRNQPESFFTRAPGRNYGTEFITRKSQISVPVPGTALNNMEEWYDADNSKNMNLLDAFPDLLFPTLALL